MSSDSTIALPDTFQLPDFIKTCPFPLRKNPHLAEIDAESSAWLDSFNFQNEAHRKALAACALGLLSAYAYPMADRERFRLCCDYVYSIVAYDDLMDEEHLAHDPVGTKKAMDELLFALRNPNVAKPEIKLIESQREFWARAIAAGCPKGTQRRLIEYTELYARAVHDQVANGCKDVLMKDVEDTTRERRDAGAVKMCFVLGEIGIGIDVPDCVFANPLVKKMEDCCNDIIVISNDIYSWNHEQAQGFTANIVTVLMSTHPNLSLQSAIDLAASEVYERYSTYFDCKSRLPSWGSETDELAQKYFSVLEDWVAGNFSWSLEGMRYFGKNAPEVKRTLMVRVLPREEKTATELRNGVAVQVSPTAAEGSGWGGVLVGSALVAGLTCGLVALHQH